MNSGDVWCPNCMRYHASLMSGHYGTAQLVDIINHYGIAQRQAGREEERQAMRQRYEEWSEGREKGAYEHGRQAGSEEERAIVEELRHDDIAFIEDRYAALVEAARFLVSEYFGPCRYGDIDSDIHDLRKALREIDEAKGGPHA